MTHLAWGVTLNHPLNLGDGVKNHPDDDCLLMYSFLGFSSHLRTLYDKKMKNSSIEIRKSRKKSKNFEIKKYVLDMLDTVFRLHWPLKTFGNNFNRFLT